MTVSAPAEIAVIYSFGNEWPACVFHRQDLHAKENRTMRAPSIACFALTVLLGACVYEPAPRYAAAPGYAAAPAPVVVYDDAYYDGYYGPFVDGYWNSGAFVYADRDHHWHRDDGHHFRHDAWQGYGHVRGSGFRPH